MMARGQGEEQGPPRHILPYDAGDEGEGERGGEEEDVSQVGNLRVGEHVAPVDVVVVIGAPVGGARALEDFLTGVEDYEGRG